MAKEKVQITMESDLLQEVDDYCDKHYMNRSWMISQACVQLVNQQKIVDAIHSISVSIRRCVDNGQIDDVTRLELQNFESLVTLLTNQK